MTKFSRDNLASQIHLRQPQRPSKLRNQLRSLHLEAPFYCYAWDWSLQSVAGYSFEEYANDLLQLSENGLARRCCVYSNHLLKINDTLYVVRLDAYGGARKDKLLLGVNQLAMAFNKLLFDHVYVFLQEKRQALPTMLRFAAQLGQAGKRKQALAALQTVFRLYEKKEF